MDGERLGTVTVAAGVLLVVGTLVVSAATTPMIGSSPGWSDGSTTVVGVHGGGHGWHEDGNVHALAEGEAVWREDSADSYFEVEQLENGSVLAGFVHSGYRECDPYDAPCARTGFRIIDPSGGEPEVVAEYSLPVRSKQNSEVHAAEPLEGGGFVFTDMEQERVVILEDGEAVWEWHASDLYNDPEDPTRRDWLHVNDVDPIGDGRFLVSVRNANQLVVLERGEGVVEVINEDDGGDDGNCQRWGQQLVPDENGDVRCGDPDVMDHQHNPHWLGDGAVLVADSGNDRVVELHRTENGSWEPVWTLTTANGIDLSWPRDADRLPNGNTLVTDTRNKRVVEVAENGTVVWSTRTERVPYEADRLPWGESVGAPRHGAIDGEAPSPSPPNDRVPGVSGALAVLRTAAPWLPFWFREVQLSLVVVGIVLGAVGAWLRWTADG